MQDCFGGTTRHDGSCGSARILPVPATGGVLSPDGCNGSVVVVFEAAEFVSLASSPSFSVVLALALALVAVVLSCWLISSQTMGCWP